MPRHLVAVLHSLPTGSGARTLRRVEIARDALSCESYSVANIYPTSLEDVTKLAHRDHDHVWAYGREEIQRELSRPETTDVLLGYGIQPPTGAQRKQYRAQLDWLANVLGRYSHRVWMFGNRPAHPSRWQRVVHRHTPGASVAVLARELLVPAQVQSISVS